MTKEKETELFETIDYRGYTIEIHQDDDPRDNPLEEDDFAPILVLHKSAKGRFGWTTDLEWADRLNGALEEIARRGFTRNLHGERGALAVISRWLAAYHGIRHVLPVGAGDHSGIWVYIGTGAHWCDPGGWDSGWVGWFFATPQQLAEWGRAEWSEQDLVESFADFKAWVSGEVYGYIVKDPTGKEVDACWGFYGAQAYEEARGDRPDGYMLIEAKAAIDAEIAHRLGEANNRFRRLVGTHR